MVNMGEATENDRKKIVIRKDSKAFFHNNVDYCVGTWFKRKSDLSISGDMDYSVMIWRSFRPMRRMVR